MNRRGMSLMELMAVSVIAGILATAVTLMQMRAVEVGKRRAARDVLEAIYAGERMYRILNGRYCTPRPPASPPPPDCSWDEVYVDDPFNVIQGVAFTVALGAGGAEFDATAARTTGKCNGRTLTLDESHVESGDWPANGQC